MKKEPNKKTIMLIALMLVTACLFAQTTSSGPDGISTVKQVFKTVYDFFTSGIVRVIAIAGVIWSGIKMITNKGDPHAMKSLIPIFVACLIIGSATFFVGKFLTDDIQSVETLDVEGWW